MPVCRTDDAGIRQLGTKRFVQLGCHRQKKVRGEEYGMRGEEYGDTTLDMLNNYPIFNKFCLNVSKI